MSISSISKILDSIEAEVYAAVKPCGFRKYGRTLHRFVSGDISQVITFQLGQAYREETYVLTVNLGIRVPECMTRSFLPEETTKKYCHEYECNIRSQLGTIEGTQISCYDLRTPTVPVISDILRQIRSLVIPFFDELSSREAILENRRKYPRFDVINNHMILLEESMIYGHSGNTAKAAELFRLYYRQVQAGQEEKPQTTQNHLTYLDGLAVALGISLTSDISE